MKNLLAAIAKAEILYRVNGTTVELDSCDPFGGSAWEGEPENIAKVSENEDGSVTYVDSEIGDTGIRLASVAEFSRFYTDLINYGWREMSLNDYDYTEN